MPANELGGGVDDDVGTVFDGPDEVRGAEGVVDDERDAVRMSKLRQRVVISENGEIKTKRPEKPVKKQEKKPADIEPLNSDEL